MYRKCFGNPGDSSRKYTAPFVETAQECTLIVPRCLTTFQINALSFADMSPSSLSAEQRIADLGLELPTARGPGGVYQPVIVSGRLAYVSGHGPLRADGSHITGRVGADLDVAAGRAAARQTGLAILSSLRLALGTLDRVTRVVKLLGMVQATPEFGDHPAVINGCSELFAEIWGPDRGVGARSAVGFISLPHAIAVEIEGIFEID
jgi:enamine deaminase RidA (YjgF/YER057c/UK114 family)